MKTYRTLCRLDFSVCYGILDKLGTYAEHLSKTLKTDPFVDGKTEIDPISREIKSSSKVKNDEIRLHLLLSAFVVDAFHPSGCELSGVAGHDGFTLATEIVARLSADGLSQYKRLGFRTFVLIDKPKYTFDRLLDYFLRRQGKIPSALTQGFAAPKDFAMVLETSTTDATYLRVNLGPYRAAESRKFFPFPSPIAEGLIMDVDVWRAAMDVPGLKLDSVLRDYQKGISATVEKIDAAIEEDLS